jgi:Fe-S cluster assembly scaffold protein SufB
MREHNGLKAICKKYSNWPDNTYAEGEYKDFREFDLIRAEKEGLGELEFEIVEAEKGKIKEGKIKEKADGGDFREKPKAIVCRLAESRQKIISCILKSPNLAYSKMQDRILAWHGAHIQDGWVVYVPKGVDAGFIHLRIYAKANSAIHHLIVLEKEAKAQVIIESKSAESNENKISSNIHSEVSETIIGEDAQLALSTIQRYCQNDWAFCHHYQRLQKFAKLAHASISLGAAVSRIRSFNQLIGQRACANSYQLFIESKSQFMDMETAISHTAKNTQGEMTCRGALDGNSVGIYRGKIMIGSRAEDTISHQSGSAILLSESCAANIIPSLHVENDQVEAGHGAIVGGLDEGEMFYLQSRGIDWQKASRLVLEGHYNEIIGRIPSEKTRKYLKELIAASLPQSSPAASLKQESKQEAKMQQKAHASDEISPGIEARPTAQALQDLKQNK